MTLLFPWVLWLWAPWMALWLRRPRRFVDTAHLWIIALLLVSLSRPAVEQNRQNQPIEARDIIIALDLSYSMRGTDLAPDRYTFAVSTLRALLELNTTDQIMLIGFTTNPLLLSPPTTDHRLVFQALESLNPDYILTRGTSLQRLFAKISTLPPAPRHLILLTDGGEETDTLHPLTQTKNLTLTIVGIGTKQGTTIPTPQGGLLKNAKGDLVISRLNPQLARLASKQSDTYITPLDTPEATARKLLQSIQSADPSTATKEIRSYLELYWGPLLVALLLFMLLHTRGVRYLLLATALFGLPATASPLDTYTLSRAYDAYHAGAYQKSQAYLDTLTASSLQAKLARAAIAYRLGRYEEAIAHYQAIRSTSHSIKQILYYNLANCHARLGAFSKAKALYLKALQFGKDPDAQANLALIARLQDRVKMQGMSQPGATATQANDTSTDRESRSKTSKDQSDQSEQAGSTKSGGEQSKKQTRSGRLLADPDSRPLPLSSKAYDLINQGYIHEKQPW
jgi:Ca-activated chloride channel family protein